jgi:predicted Zn-dependent protease
MSNYLILMLVNSVGLFQRLLPCMPTILMLGLAIGSVLTFSGCTTAGASQNRDLEDPSVSVHASSSTTRYTAHMFHHNRPLLWQQSHLALHCPDATLQPLVKKAFTPWQESLSTVYPITLRFVETPTDADIIITTAPSLDAKVQWDASNRRGYTAALTKPVTYNAEANKLDTVTIELATQNSSGLPQTTETLQRVLLHEFGHALGLWGHSSNGFDVMSPNFYKGLGQKNAGLSLSQNDVETLQALYQQGMPTLNPQNYAETTLTQKATYTPVASLARQQALLETSPSWQGYWKLARGYRDASQPLQADVAYGKALQLKGTDAGLYLERVQAFQYAGMNTEALALLSPMPNSYSGAGRLTLEKAWLMVKLNRISEARTLVQEGLQQTPSLANDPITKELLQYL